ncbi:MAG TPA: hypothetical protein VL383_13760 [Gemmatimonadaceae bacterium]|jgi:hypothetical protein|nr:hypothetical protein [Gemmatimonadaceae bacterium]
MLIRIREALVVAALSSSRLLIGQARSLPPWDGGKTISLGQPSSWKWTTGGGMGTVLSGPAPRGSAAGFIEGRLALQRDLWNPLISVAALQSELYVRSGRSGLDEGLRARLISPGLRVGAGVDYQRSDGSVAFSLAVTNPIRRGGLFSYGGWLRLDYVPAHDHTFVIGVEQPIFRHMPVGRTRPGRDYVPLSRSRGLPAEPNPDTVLQRSIEPIREAADHIRRMSIPFLDQNAWRRANAEAGALAELRDLKTLFRTKALTDGSDSGAEPTRGAFEIDVRRYHAAIEHAFALAVGGDESRGSVSDSVARIAAARARAILLDHVLLPYDRLLGQVKKDDTVLGFAADARGVFLQWVYMSAAVPANRRAAMLWVFTQLLDVIEANRGAARAQWGDSRFVWLPLQYALLPEDHDTQAELDSLVERAVGGGNEFSEGNFVSYVINEQFQYHLSRTIRQARAYHVLWTHDFRGIDDSGNPDELSYRQVLRSYLAAMIERVQAYDSTGRFPVYMILLDEWSYERTKGRIWMSLLEDPTRHHLRLPDGFEAWEDSIATAQKRLRDAIAASPLLQAQRRQYGDKWLRNLIKVQVNITNRADMSFFSGRVVPGMAMPDIMLRDHRKIVFYDVAEEDPYRGEVIYTGAGVGESYSNLSWEDRALLVRGPAALGVKDAARAALLAQGFHPDQIPYALRARPKARDYDARVRAAMEQGQRPVRAMELMNNTGFADKEIDVAKAVLYTLMPPGSVIKIPDSLWSGAFWGSAVVGCALRGVRVLVIAPAQTNAPAKALGTLGRSQELLWRLLTAARVLAPEIEASGGLLKVGLFASHIEVTNIPAKVQAVNESFAAHPWLRQLFGFAPSAYAELDEMARTIAKLDMQRRPDAEFEHDDWPKLHLKANFFASREAWQFMTRPEWPAITWEYVQQRIAQVQTRSAAVNTFDGYPDAWVDVGGAVVQDWFNSLDARTRERVVFYTLFGSQNQNTRSMVVDGEVCFVVSHWPSVIPYLDFIALAGESQWLDDPADLAALLPPHSEWLRRIERWIKLLI